MAVGYACTASLISTCLRQCLRQTCLLWSLQRTGMFCITTYADLTFAGAGCGLQIRRGLAAQWFDSTWSAAPWLGLLHFSYGSHYDFHILYCCCMSTKYYNSTCSRSANFLQALPGRLCLCCWLRETLADGPPQSCSSHDCKPLRACWDHDATMAADNWRLGVLRLCMMYACVLCH